MSDYNIDDILAEIDKRRDGGDDRDKYSASVTEIIGGNELEQAMRRSGAKPRRTEEEIAFDERSEELLAQRRAEELAQAAQAAKDKKAAKREEQERLRAEREEQRAQAAAMRREREARRAAEEAERQRIEAERAAEEERLRRLEQEALSRQEQADEAEELSEQAEEISGFTAELSSPDEAAKLFSETGEHEMIQPESEYVQPFYKPDASESDDDIIFHTRGDLVSTATQQLRKQQRIEEINRALLAADMSAESSDDLLNSINPMESRAKAEVELKNASGVPGDTLTVAGNDLKRLAGSEDSVKEYSPVTSRRKNAEQSDFGVDSIMNTASDKDDDVVEFATAKQRRSNEALVASLNKKLKEQREKNLEIERTVTLSDLSESEQLPPHALNIDEKKLIDTGILAKRDPIQAIREADELAARKKRRIASFILEDIEDDVSEAPENDDDAESYEQEEEVIDLDDENVIIERLKLASRGLTGRLVILALLMAAAIFAGVVFRLDIRGIPIISKLCSKSSTINFLYTNLTLGVLSFAACSSVITNGLSRLVKLRPDSDTLCAFSHIGALAALIVYLDQPSMLTLNNTHVFLIVSLGSLCFNTVAKLCTVKAAQNNFSLISGDRSKFFIECSGDEGSEKLARGLGTGIPVVASMRKTELLCDFIVSTYCEDVSDRIARYASPIVLLCSLLCGVMTYCMSVSEYVMQNVSLAAGAATAVLAVGATFTGALVVMLPMLSATKSLGVKNAAVLGYSAVEDMNETTAVLVEAKSLFPVNSVKVNNIWDYNKNGSKGTQHIQIDDAIIFAASLAVSADSVLADAFFNMLNYKSALLKKVSNCVYESNLGVMGWIGSRRVLLGNRDHMKSHGVAVPEAKKEAAVNKNHDEVVYLAVGGEVCMLFFVQLTANTQVKHHIKKLSDNGISLVIKTVDGMITEGMIAELFDIGAEGVRVIPYEAHEEFDERTKYVSKGSAAVSCDGTFSSFASAVNGCKSIHRCVKLGCIMQIAGLALGVLLVFIFAFLGNYDVETAKAAYYDPYRTNYFDMYNAFYISLYNLIWLFITAASQALVRLKK
ncbi:MAG: hypothetical protein ACI4KA_02515 [Oscillospiraceae bacterium]